MDAEAIQGFHLDTPEISEVVGVRSVHVKGGERAEDEITQAAVDLRRLTEAADTAGIINNFVCQEIITRLQQSLLRGSKNAKHAAYILKCLTSYFLNSNINDFQSSDRQTNQTSLIYLHKGLSEFKRFWSTFFDLFEILDEKQSHIIEPFLLKLKSDVFAAPEAKSWFRILVFKLLQHDNRMLAKEGLKIYIQNTARSSPPGFSEVDKKFVQFNVFPILKDRVGWILPDPKELHNVAEELACLVCQNEFLDTDLAMLLELIVSSETSMSPVSTYFFVLAGTKELELKLLSSKTPTSSGKPSGILKALTVMNFILAHRLASIDKFLKTKTQEIFIRTLRNLLSPNPVTNKDDAVSPPYLPQVLYFLGALGVEVFSRAAADLQATLKTLVLPLCGDQSENTSESSLTSPNCSVQRLGMYRFHYLLNGLDLFRISLEKTLTDMALVEPRLERTREHLSNLADILYCEANSKSQVSSSAQKALSTVFAVLERQGERSEADMVAMLSPVPDLIRYPHLVRMELTQARVTKLWELLGAADGQRVTLLVSILLLLSNEEDLMSCLSQDADLRDHFRERFIHLCAPHQFDGEDRSRRNELNAQFLRLQLTCLLEVLRRPTVLSACNLEEDSLQGLLLQAFNTTSSALHVSSDQSIPIGIQILNRILELASDSKLVPNVAGITEEVPRIWSTVMDLHKTESFVDALNAFAALISSPCFSGTEILTKYSDEIFQLSEQISGISLLVTENLSRVDLSPLFGNAKFHGYLDEYLRVNVLASCAGPAIPKSSRLTFMIWEYLCGEEAGGNEESLNYDWRLSLPFNGAPKGRFIAVLNILGLLRLERERGAVSFRPLLRTVVDSLLRMNSKDGADKRRYFSGSFVHRYKQRIVQTLLILQPLFDLDLSCEVLEALTAALGRDGPQASVRYLTEWIIINVLLKFPVLHQVFFSASKEYCQLRPGYGCLFSTMALHTASSVGDTHSEESQRFYDDSLRLITGLLMGQNFTVRIYGNICFCKIYERAVQLRLSRVVGKYFVVAESAEDAVATAAGNFRKIYEQISQDFYIQTFSPRLHYHAEVILNLLPKLAGIPSDEVVHLRDVAAILNNNKNAGADTFVRAPADVVRLYENYESSWQLKSNLIDGREHGEEERAEGQDGAGDSSSGSNPAQFQVKGNPWKYLPAAEELSDFSEDIQVKKRSLGDGLVVVASLIDRIPNLGGLCRTCEVFGASKYVISSLKILDDQQFKSMSVSAHRWVDILEVPVYELRSLLASYTQKGYTIVGVEQALDSTNLNTFQFPKKTLLLLGNEKYGIPTDLLNMVDKCVEIPQVGLIRSLNVHVTGALCIWQYATQNVI